MAVEGESEDGLSIEEGGKGLEGLGGRGEGACRMCRESKDIIGDRWSRGFKIGMWHYKLLLGL